MSTRIILALALAVAPAAGLSVDARLDRTVVGVGETVQLSIVVRGSAEASVEASLPPVEGVRVAGPSTSRVSQVSIVNGRQEMEVATTLSYQLTPLREGDFVIPEFAVTVGGRTSTVGPLRFRATPTPQSASLKLRASVDTSRPFVQQPLTYRVTWYVGAQVHGYELVAPALEVSDDWVVSPLDPGSGRGVQDLVVNGKTYRAAVGRETLDGVEYVTFTVSVRLFPLREGVLQLPAPVVRASIQQGWEVVRDWFFAERRPRLVNLTAVGNAVTLAVQPLPVHGRPRGFSGAVGSYSFSVDVLDSVVRVGDPVRLKMRVAGSGLLSRIPKPDLSVLPEVTRDFAVVGTFTPGEVGTDAVVFEEIVRPRHTGISQFPALPFSFFDPVRGEYRTVWSRPQALRVSPSPQVGPVESFGSPEETRRTPTEAEGGIRAPYRGPRLTERWGNPWAPMARLVWAPVAYGLWAGGVWLSLRLRSGGGWVARLRARMRRGRAGRLERLAREGAQDFVEELAKVCREGVAARMGASPSEVTPHDVGQWVEQARLDPQVGARLREVLQDLDAARFAPTSLDLEARLALVRRVRGVLREVKPR